MDLQEAIGIVDAEWEHLKDLPTDQVEEYLVQLGASEEIARLAAVS